MLLVRVDAAVDPAKCGLALGEWSCRRRDPVRLRTAGTMSERGGLAGLLMPALAQAERVLVAIDAPLGWPASLARALHAHAAGAHLDSAAHDLFRRTTDRRVREVVGKQTLDVGADRIARTAKSALDILEQARQLMAEPIELAWQPNFAARLAAIEVYPAGTLKARQLPCIGYKRSGGAPTRKRIARALGAEIAGLHRHAAGQDDVFDACLCLVAARDFLLGEAVAPSPTEAELARREGWIWVRGPQE
jgi:hypothetical protein